MVAALVAFTVILWGEIQFLPSEWSLSLKLLLGIIPTAGMLASLLLALLADEHVDLDDLWDSRWFKYMRGIWGRYFGGSGQYLTIDNCKAFWLIFLTIIFWFVDVAIVALFFWMLVASVTLHNILPMKTMVEVVVYEAFMCAGFAFIGFVSSYALLRKAALGHPRVLYGVAIWLSAVLLVAFLFVIPLELVSLATYVLWAGGVIGVIALLFIILGGFVPGFVAGGITARIVIVPLGLFGGFVGSIKKKTCVVTKSKKPRR